MDQRNTACSSKQRACSRGDPVDTAVLERQLDEARQEADYWRHEAEWRHRRMFQHHVMPGLLIEPDNGCIIDANAAALAFYGYSRKQIQQLHICDINTLDEAELKRERERARDEKRSSFSFIHRLANGETRDVQVVSGPMQFEGRTVLHSIVHDVTDTASDPHHLWDYQRLFSELPVGLCRLTLDSDSRFLDANPAMASILGMSHVDALIGRTLAHFHSDPESLIALMQQLDDGGSVHGQEFSIIRQDGHITWVRLSARKRIAANSEKLLEGAIEDITHEKGLENELRLMAKTFQTGQAVMIVDHRHRIIRVNDAFCRATGYSPETVIGQSPAFFNSGCQSKVFYDSLWKTLGHTGHWEGDIWNRLADGKVYPLWETIDIIADSQGQPEYFVSVFHDISAQKALEKELQHFAEHDRLTGIYNRTRLYRELAASLDAYRQENTPFSLIMLDIDRFKEVNDRFGHDAGDEVLSQLSEVISSQLRRSDSFDEHFGRWGGEEFMVLLSGASIEEASLVAERLRRCVAETDFSRVGKITISLGVAQMEPNMSQEALERSADKALYQAKEKGRNRVEMNLAADESSSN